MINTMKGLVICIALLWAKVISVAHSTVVSSGNYTKDFHATLVPHNNVRTSQDGHTTTMVLRGKYGAEITSNRQFLFGQYDMNIKLTKWKSTTGGVVTYKLTSSDDKRDEISYEIRSNGNDHHTLITNIYINGQLGCREEKIQLWFDPTASLNQYSIFWNIYHVVFKVNGLTIREFKNKGNFLSAKKPMNLKVSIYKDGNKGTDETEIVNKKDMPKTLNSVTLKDYNIDSCAVNQFNNVNKCVVPSKDKWWNYPEFRYLTSKEAAEIELVRKNYLINSYCLHPYPKKTTEPRE